MTPRIILWRHGQTAWNAQGRHQGQADIPLDEAGEHQIRLAARVLADEWQPTAIISSPLQRAYATAGALAELTGLAVATDPRLMEINVGSWEGLTLDEIFAVEPPFKQAWADETDYRRSPEGETSAECGARVGEAIGEIEAAAGPDDTVVIASHGLAIRMGIGHLFGWDFHESLRLGSLANASFSVLQRHQRRDGFRVLAYNLTAPGILGAASGLAGSAGSVGAP